ncbi:MAG: HPP family protein [Thermotogota bacterium]|nr:HPP family protein [Thermotogota bacterium]
MGLLDSRFKGNKKKYIIQILLATLLVLIVLLLLDTVSDVVVIASFGASSFIVFSVPNSSAAGVRFVLGGNITGILSAFLVNLIGVLVVNSGVVAATNEYYQTVLGAISVGLAMFLMVIFNTEHPPAAGLALGICLEGFDYLTALITITGIIILLLFKRIFKKYLINLL